MDSATLTQLIQNGESATLEFKIAPPRISELAERICGFANSQFGGLIVIGVADQTLEVVGVKSTSDAVDIILQAARLCKPQVSLNPLQPEVVLIDDKPLVVAQIPPNKGTLYQAGGVCWIRRGSHTVPLTVPEIERFLYSKGILDWETRAIPAATLEDLDMNLVEEYLQNRPSRRRTANRLQDFERILVSIGCAAADSKQEPETSADKTLLRPTNAGILLFGKNPQDFLLQSEVVCVLYRDNLGLRNYADRRIFHGTISEQIEQTADWLNKYIPIQSRVEGFHRIDEPEYSIEALREAIVNALVHRDYSIKSASVRVFFYPDRIEVRNPGLLPPELELEELKRGIARSEPRNPVIATVLRDLPEGYMDKMGSGIAFMLKEMQRLGKPEPEFKELGEFIVTFFLNSNAANAALIPNSTSDIARPTNSDTTLATSVATANGATLSPNLPLVQKDRLKLVLTYLQQHDSITNKQYRELTGVSEKTAFRDLEILVEQGTVRAIGERRARYYTR